MLTFKNMVFDELLLLLFKAYGFKAAENAISL